MNRILITGVAGFIGSNLAKHLLENNKNEIFGIDNFSSSTMSNLYPLLKCSNFHFIEHDVSNEMNFCVDTVYHFAGNGDLKHYYNDKYNFITKQMDIIKNIINYTQINGAKLIVPTRYIDFQESNKELFQLFDMYKLFEDLIIELIDKNKISANLVRLDYVYGENMPFTDNRFIIKNTISALKDENIKTDFDSSNYFTYIQDVILNLEKIANNYIEDYYIDLINPNLYLKSDILKLIIGSIKSKTKLQLNSAIQIHPKFKPNPYNKNGCNLECTTSVLEGMIKTAKYYKLMYLG